MEIEELTVEAGVRARQSLFVAIVTMDIEAANTVHTLQLLESVERNFRSTGDKLEQLGPLLLVEGPNSTPKPLYLLRSGSVIVILGVALPVIDINIGQTGDQQLQLLLIENGDKLGRDDIMEACEVIRVSGQSLLSVASLL